MFTIYGFSDGNRLSDDDQKFILESVFSYHPDKQSKVADQLDYIVVSNAEFSILIKSTEYYFSPIYLDAWSIKASFAIDRLTNMVHFKIQGVFLLCHVMALKLTSPILNAWRILSR